MPRKKGVKVTKPDRLFLIYDEELTDRPTVTASKESAIDVLNDFLANDVDISDITIEEVTIVRRYRTITKVDELEELAY